jgi:UDPglucose 6-dehydrogenase
MVAKTVSRNLKREIPFQVVYNPEFMQEGTAIVNFMHPDRLIFGSDSPEAASRVAKLFERLHARVVITDLHTAEMVKYASNAFLATRISFINEIAQICEAVGADVKLVGEAMGLDHRIGPRYLEAGIGYGGSCLPKDVRALTHMARGKGARPRLLRAVMEINQVQREVLVQKLEQALGGNVRGKQIGMLGLAFKPGTDDVRDAPSLDIVRILHEDGAKIRAYDPVAMPVFKLTPVGDFVEYAEDPYGAATDADAVAVLTEWDEFKKVDLERLKMQMRRPLIIDGRNIFDPALMHQMGIEYRGIGRRLRE